LEISVCLSVVSVVSGLCFLCVRVSVGKKDHLDHLCMLDVLFTLLDFIVFNTHPVRSAAPHSAGFHCVIPQDTLLAHTACKAKNLEGPTGLLSMRTRKTPNRSIDADTPELMQLVAKFSLGIKPTY